MSVGLYDADFFKYHQTIFNLELMKLATYFKRKREITMLSPTFSPERYTKFYFRQDFNDGKFPQKITQYNNLYYGGYAFSNNKYIPLPEDIERCTADSSIYTRYRDLFVEDKITTKSLFTSLRAGLHFRLSLDGKNIWERAEKQIPIHAKTRILFLHDFNLNEIKDAAEYIKILMEKYRISPLVSTSLCTKFPIICDDFSSFNKWLDFIFSSVYFKLQYNGLFTDEEICAVAASVNKSSAQKIIYNPTPAAFSKNDFSEEALIKIFKQVLFLYRNQKQFLLICNDSFKIPQIMKKMFALFTGYGRSAIEKPTSMYYFVKNLRETNQYHREIISKPEAIEVFSYCQKEYPELFKMFYENSGAFLKGGQLEIE